MCQGRVNNYIWIPIKDLTFNVNYKEIINVVTLLEDLNIIDDQSLKCNNFPKFYSKLEFEKSKDSSLLTMSNDLNGDLHISTNTSRAHMKNGKVIDLLQMKLIKCKLT